MEKQNDDLEGKTKTKNFSRRNILGCLTVGGLALGITAAVPLSFIYDNLRDIKPIDINQYQTVSEDELLSHPTQYAGKLIEIEEGKIVIANYSTYNASLPYRITSSRHGRIHYKNKLELMVQLKKGSKTMMFEFGSDFADDSYKQVNDLVDKGKYSGRFVLRGRLENASSDRFRYLVTYGHSIDLEDETGKMQTFYLSDRHARNIPQTDNPY